MTDNKKIAEQVLRAVGGAANLKDATHCMTRLRLYLKDDSVPKDDDVKKISGVLGVVRGGQQYQIIIGTNVPKVYEELCKLAGISANAAVKVVDDGMQIMGGISVASEHRINRFWRDLRVDRISGGTDEMMILTTAKNALKKYR